MTQNNSILAEIVDNTRDLAHFYIAKFDENNWFNEPEINGKKLNSFAWNLCHIAWAQNFLILQACSDKAITVDWFNSFAINTIPPARDKYPAIEDIKKVLNQVHVISMDVLNSISTQELQKQNNTQLLFKKGNSKLHIINHHIRHEAMHIGHLSTLCKIFDVKTI